MLAGLAWLNLATQNPISEPICKDLSFESKILANNPLKDPTLRHVAVFRPANTSGARLPLVIYEPGYGGSSLGALNDQRPWLAVVKDLMSAGRPIVLAVIDGTDHYGCSQYVNSPATGRYLDYICDEVVPFVEKSEHCGGSSALRLVAGHSSGGFGALRAGMARKSEFGGVVALSPDSYFDVTHRPFTLDPAAAKTPLAKVQALQPPTLAPLNTVDGGIGYALNLCADYAGNRDGTFSWLYDADGKYRNDTYARWQAADPAVIAASTSRPFNGSQRVYLDGAAQDEFKANEGATKVHDNLKGKVREKNLTLYLPPGHHSDHLVERLERGIRWVLVLPTTDIS